MDYQDLWPMLQRGLARQLSNGLSHASVAEVCQADVVTVMRWGNKGMKARGQYFNALWHVLDMLDEQVKQETIKIVPPYQWVVGDLYAFGIIDLQTACELFGVKNPQAAFRCLRGQEPMHPAFTIEELLEAYGEQRNARREEIRSELKPQSPVPEVPVTKDVPAAKSTSEPTRATIALSPPQTLASLLGAALPLARYLESDECTPEVRSKFRSLLGAENLFDLSNLLNALCSERSRKEGRRQ